MEDFCFILNPKADTQSTKIPFREYRWVGPYKVEKALPNNNYIVRKLGTVKTQILHRIRLRKFNPVSKPPDIITKQTDFERDDEIIVSQDDLYAITWETNFGDTPFETSPNDADNDLSLIHI